MGTYNITCSLTDITIYPKDKIYVIPLLKRNSYNSFEFDQATSLYKPYSMPIACQYADGGLSDIVASTTTEILEKKLGLTMEQFFEFFFSDRSIYDSHSFLCSKYIHEELQKVLRNDFEELSLDPLLPFGFEKKDDFYVHEDLLIKIDPTKNHPIFLDFSIRGKEVRGMQSLVSILSIISKETGVFLGLKDQKDHEAVSTLDNLSLMFVHESAYLELGQNWGFNSYLVKIEDFVSEFMTDLAEMEDEELDSMFPFHPLNPKYMTRYSYLKELCFYCELGEEYLPFIPNNTGLHNELDKFINLSHNMFEVSKMFRPALSGPQIGNSDAINRLLNITASLNKKQSEKGS